jgi:Pentapeptide repeats (8 copies)
MANREHMEVLGQGADAWNSWVKSAGARPDLEDADLKGWNLSGYRLKEAILKGAKLNRADLRRAKLDNAYLRRANLTGADLSGASLSGANLRHAVLRNARLAGAYLRRVDLSYVDLRGADLTGSVLEYARLVDVNLDGATLSDCLIYGASVWNLIGAPKEQSNLVITRAIARGAGPAPRGGGASAGPAEPRITVDDLEVAQFIYLLLNHRKLRNTLNSVTERGVLLLGRFGDGGLSLLQALASKLRELGYLPIIFDFERPERRDYTETVQTLAGLSRFAVVDLSGPSVPHELHAVVPHVKIPYVPIIEEGRKPYAMFADLLQYDWVVRPVLRFAGEAQLLELLPSKIVGPAEQRYERRRALLKEIFG